VTAIEGPKYEITARPADDAGNAANAKVRFILWCKACGYQVEPEPRRDGSFDTARTRRFWIGGTGLSVPGAVVERSTWW
jgi:hypothetical protein